MKEIFGEYVFTVDNFIYMRFILLRIRTKYCVIMIGETLCRKTSLIR